MVPRAYEKKPEKISLISHVRNFLKTLIRKYQVVVPHIVTTEQPPKDEDATVMPEKPEQPKTEENEINNITYINIAGKRKKEEAHQKHLRRRERRVARIAEFQARTETMEANQQPEKPQEIFKDLLDENLSVTNIKSAIQEKIDGIPRRKTQKRRPTAKQHIKQIENRENIPTIDLHGLTQKEAKKELANLINKCRGGNEKFMCIITGKGNGSKNGVSILRPFIRKLLKKCAENDLIEHFEDAPPKLGGKGAFIIILK